MYSEQEKKVFQYHDGTAEVFGDPVTIHRRLTAYLDGNPNQVIEATQNADPLAAMHANDRLLAAVRVAFEMPFDKATGEGATEDECFAALDKFTEYLEKKGPNGASTPTCEPPSGQED